jgi:hypothetical protein
MSTFTIITENNATPPSGVAINALGTDAFTNFSQVAGDPNALGTVGNTGDKVLDSVSRILYIYNGTWVAIAFVTA